MAACGRNPVTPSSTESAGSALSSSDVSGDSATTGGTETADTTQNTESNSPAQTTTAGKVPTKSHLLQADLQAGGERVASLL